MVGRARGLRGERAGTLVRPFRPSPSTADSTPSAIISSSALLARI